MKLWLIEVILACFNWFEFKSLINYFLPTRSFSPQPWSKRETNHSKPKWKKSLSREDVQLIEKNPITKTSKFLQWNPYKTHRYFKWKLHCLNPNTNINSQTMILTCTSLHAFHPLLLIGKIILNGLKRTFHPMIYWINENLSRLRRNLLNKLTCL